MVNEVVLYGYLWNCIFPCVNVPDRDDDRAPVMTIEKVSFVPGSPLSRTLTVKNTTLLSTCPRPVNVTSFVAASYEYESIESETR